SIRDQPIQILSVMGTNALKNSEGTFSIIARVTGSRKQPNISGEATVNAKRLRVANFATGLRDLNGTLKLEGDRLVVQDGFSAITEITRRGVTDPKRSGDPITLRGSLPLGFGEGTPPASGEGIALQAERVYFDENPLPGTVGGGASGMAKID